jgi:murein DD-endopeptidase MepM/ murein hydrolase activator NlpD
MRARFFLGILCGVAVAMQARAQVVEIQKATHSAASVQLPTAQTEQATASKKIEHRVAAHSVNASAPAKPKIASVKYFAAVRPIEHHVAVASKVPAKRSISIHAEKRSVAKSDKKESSHKKGATSSKITIADMRKAGERARERVEEQTRAEHSRSSRVVSRQRSESKVAGYRSSSRSRTSSESLFSRLASSDMRMETAFIKLADGFDFPVGKPDAQGYYKAQGFRPHHHLGEDWDGIGGGDTDLGDPIYSIGDGVVVFARDCHQGWGNVVIVRHAYRDRDGMIRNIDSFYGHLQKILVHRGEAVRRGEQIAKMGTAHGLYDAHLHFEIRKNIEIGMSRAKFAEDYSNYYDPSKFILSHRHLSTNNHRYRIAMNTFTQDARIRWDKLRNFSHAHTGGSSRESAYALKKALAAQNSTH